MRHPLVLGRGRHPFVVSLSNHMAPGRLNKPIADTNDAARERVAGIGC